MAQMLEENYILSCDWGTSSFRLRLVDRYQEAVVAEVANKKGVAHTHQAWLKPGIKKRIDFFADALEKNTRALGRQVKMDLTGIPLIVSGMASSSIGLEELPYAQLPFDLGGKSVVFRKIDLPLRTLYLISGLRSQHDVMRGEETQAIGLARLTGQQNWIGIFPGTHSKHVEIKNGQIFGFKTYMTGEVFQIISHHSILAHSVQPADEDASLHYFTKGVKMAQEGSLLAQLFQVRTNALLHHLDPEKNYLFLSGLFIGSELNSLSAPARGETIILCGSRKMMALYRLALKTLGIGNCLALPDKEVELASMYGHLELMEHLFRKT